MKVNSPVPIREAYRGYTPPRYVTRTVAKLLRSTPAKYLAGLDCVVLSNFSGQPRRHRLGKVPRKGRKVRKDQVTGLYHPAWQESPPWIELYVDKIIDAAKGAPLWMPYVREFIIGEVLYHELGHHIHYWIRPEYREREDVADNWSKKLFANHMNRSCSYLFPLLKPVFKLYRALKGQKASPKAKKA